MRWNDVPLTSRTFYPKIAIFPQFEVYLSITQAKQIINLLILNNFYPVISYRRVQKKKKATNYRTRFGHSLWSAISCQRKRLNNNLLKMKVPHFTVADILKKKKKITEQESNFREVEFQFSNFSTQNILVELSKHPSNHFFHLHIIPVPISASHDDSYIR